MCSPQYCPIARAIKRQLPEEETDVFVGSGSIRIGSVGWLRQSQAAMRFIDRFDKALPVKPFCFMATIESIMATRKSI